VLLQLKQQYPMVLVSNFYGNIATVLKEFKLDGIFDTIIESAVVGVRKPDPQIFTLGVEALGMRPDEVVVVGDSMDKDIIPASKAGCHTVWFKGEGWTNDPVDESAAEKVITDLTQIL
jgi:putative hydrolase of the HAD superfamily